jgi:hypothetical protein
MNAFTISAFAKAGTQSTLKFIYLFFLVLMSAMATAQSWTGTWKTNAGEIPVKQRSTSLQAKFTMNSQAGSEQATLFALVKSDHATGTITVASGNKMYFKWKLVDNNTITGRISPDRNQLDSSFGSVAFNAKRVQTATPTRQVDLTKRTATVKKDKDLSVVMSADTKARVNKFNKRLDESRTVSGTRPTVVEKNPAKAASQIAEEQEARRKQQLENERKWREAEAIVNKANEEARKANQAYKITLCKLYVYEPHVTILNQDHEVYGIMGIRAYKFLGGHRKASEIPNIEQLPARSWSVSSKSPKTVQANSGTMKTVSDPTGKSFTYQGSITLDKSRSFKITDRYLEEGAQVNIQMNLAEADPGIDDNFPWKQRSLVIEDMQLGKEYLVIQSEEDEKRYKIAVSFKVEKI